MLSFESEERPTFLELRDIINAKQLQLNLNNEAYVEGLLKEKINQNDVELENYNSSGSSPEAAKKDSYYQANTEFQIGGMMAGGATMQIK